MAETDPLDFTGKVVIVQSNSAGDSVMLIDLTAAFGAGHEPTAAQMDAYLAYWLYSYFEGAENIARMDKLLPYLLAAIRDLQAAI